MPETHGPIQRMLERYISENALRFHMPGHKGRLELPGGEYDLTEIPGTDTLFDPCEGIAEAAEAAAQSFGAGFSFLLVNGSTAGIQAMALWAKTRGRQLLLSRDCHLSAVHACALAGIQPVWVEPAWDTGEQLFRWDISNTIKQSINGESAFFLTYPDYYGRCVDLDELRNRLRGRDAVLLVDSAHGAHFVFSDRLPPHAGVAADIWVTGAHKTLPAPTQTAFLHVRNSEDVSDAARLLRGVTTASPSYLLMVGLDNAGVFMDANRARLNGLVEACHDFADRINRMDGLRCWTERDARSLGYARHDPTRLVVDVRALGISGWEAGARLRGLGLQAEMCDIYRVVLIATVMDEHDTLEKAAAVFQALAASGTKHAFTGRIAAIPAQGRPAMPIRGAWLSETREVKMRLAVGRIAAEPFGAYPPGIPFCMPGEIVETDAIAAMEEACALGGSLFGVRDGKISVVKA